MSLFYKIWLAVVLMVATNACQKVQPMAYDEVLKESDRLLERTYLGQEDVSRPVSLYEAYARALSYNLDYRLSLLQNVLTRKELDFSRYALLPQLTYEAGWSKRDTQYSSVSEPTRFTENEVNQISLGLPISKQNSTPSTSQEKEGTDYSAALVFNTLDFSLAYFNSKQKGYEVLRAGEEKRRVIQNVISEVTKAYWEAVAAQTFQQELDSIILEVRAALKTAQLLQKRKLRNVTEGIEYQRGLIQTLRQLNAQKRVLVQARHRLSSLLNIPKGHAYTVGEQDFTLGNFFLASLSDQELKKLALSQRPEIIQQFYDMQIGKYGEKSERWRLLPSIGLRAAGYYDSNEFLVENKWADGNAGISMNLMRLASYPKMRKISKLKKEAQETRTQALMAAVLSQSEISKQNFLDSLESYCLVQQLSELEDMRLKQYQARMSVRSGNDLVLIRTRVENLLVNLEKANEFAELQSSYGLLMKTVGIDPVPDAVPGYDLDELAEAFKMYFEHQLPVHLEDALIELENVELLTRKSREEKTVLQCG